MRPRRAWMAESPPALGRRYTWKGDQRTRHDGDGLQARMSFERKIAEGQYLFESVPCFCGGNEGELVATDRYGMYYPLVLCPRCGILRANPRMTAASYATFYSDEYRALYGDGDDDGTLVRDFNSNVKEGERIRRTVLDSVGGRAVPRVVFDIGCNMGSMLVPWKAAGCDVFGVDFNRRRIEVGRHLSGIADLHVGGIDELLTHRASADLVILCHVLEHFTDLDLLATIRRCLAPSGYVYVELPGTFWWIRNVCGGDILGLLQNAHTYQFSLGSLRYVMECSGFEMVSGTEAIVSVFRVSNHFRDKADVPAGEARRVMAYLRRRELLNTPRRHLSRAAARLGVKPLIRILLDRALAGRGGLL